jgi:type VII secretion integral membrane protein EccD
VTTPVTADLRRVTLVAPQGRFDVVLPASVPLAYLIPTLLQQAGPELAEAGIAHGGWVVQRLGGLAFDTGQSAAALGLADGEVLYLRPRRAELPTPVFDDAAEAISRTLAEQTPRWSRGTSRIAGLAVATVLMLAGAAGLLLAGPPWRLPAVAAGAAALLLLAAAALTSRAVGDALTGAVLGCGAGVFGALAGLLGFAQQHAGLSGSGAAGLAAGGSGLVAGGSGLVAGSSVGLVIVTLAAVLVGTGTPVFAGAAVVAAAGMAAGLTAPHAAAGGGAAAAVCVAFLVMPFVPGVSYRSARLPKPFLPGSAEELRRGEEAVPPAEMARRTLLASDYMTCLVAACALISVVAAAVLVAVPGWAAPALVGAAAALALLRSRLFTSRAQRGALIAAAAVSAAILVTGLTARFGGGIGARGAADAGIAVLGVVAAIVAAAATAGPSRSGSPLTARLLDIVELAAAVAVIPLVLEVLGVYAKLRSL